MKIYFARRGLRDSPSSIELYMDAQKLTTRYLNQASIIVFENIDDLQKLLKIPFAAASIPKVLIRTEPAVVSPNSYVGKNLSEFASVISLGTVAEKGEGVFHWPQEFAQSQGEELPKLSERIDNPVMVTSNKISFVEKELYSLRREVIFELPGLVLLGYLWARGPVRKALVALKELWIAVRSGAPLSKKALKYFFRRPQNYLGQTKNKRQALSAYKYCIVIENSPTYLSEKLFDALFAGCIPIYVGPKVADFGIPSGLVFEADESVSSVNESLEIARNLDLRQWENLRKEFLSSSQTRLRWKTENVYSDLISRLTVCVES